MGSTVLPEVVHPAALSLPRWPTVPEAVDASGTSFLIVAFGAPGAAEIAGAWAHEASSRGPVVCVDAGPCDAGGAADVVAALSRARTGVRVMIVGSQYDVLRGLALAREHGLAPDELRSHVVHVADLPLFCAHCRGTHRVPGAPGDEVACPGCARRLEIHPHLSAVRGSFLASDATAREIA